MNRKVLWIIIVAVIILSGFIIFNLKSGCNFSPGIGRVNGSASALAVQAKELLAKGDLTAAKNVYLKLLNGFTNSSEAMNWQKKIEELNIKLLFSTLATPQSIIYEVKPGDTLNKIAREFKTTPELIVKSNNLNGMIIPGKKLKVWNAPFVILVNKPQNILILKCEEEIVKTYLVSTGKNNSTPAGTFKITNKLLNPTWFKKGDSVIAPADPKNALGTRWLGINLPGYGIHGTIEPRNLGKQVTEGCIRMSNSDIEELYIIVPVGTEVVIVD